MCSIPVVKGLRYKKNFSTFQDLNPFCGSAEVWPKKPIQGLECRIPEMMDHVYDCMMDQIEKFSFPIEDDAFEFIVRAGTCAAARIEYKCLYGDKFSSTKERENEYFEMAWREIPGIVKVIAQNQLKNLPEDFDEMKDRILMVLSAFVEENIVDYIDMAEKMMGKTIPEAIREIIIWIETTFMTSKGDIRPIRDSVLMGIRELKTFLREDLVTVCDLKEDVRDFLIRWLDEVDWNIPNWLNCVDKLEEFIWSFIKG